MWDWIDSIFDTFGPPPKVFIVDLFFRHQSHLHHREAIVSYTYSSPGGQRAEDFFGGRYDEFRIDSGVTSGVVQQGGWSGWTKGYDVFGIFVGWSAVLEREAEVVSLLVWSRRFPWVSSLERYIGRSLPYPSLSILTHAEIDSAVCVIYSSSGLVRSSFKTVPMIRKIVWIQASKVDGVDNNDHNFGERQQVVLDEESATC